MSDGVLIAFIGLIGILGTPIVNHYLGRSDRALANSIVVAKNAEIEAMKVKYNDDINNVKGELSVCQHALAKYTVINP